MIEATDFKRLKYANTRNGMTMAFQGADDLPGRDSWFFADGVRLRIPKKPEQEVALILSFDSNCERDFKQEVRSNNLPFSIGLHWTEDEGDRPGSYSFNLDLENQTLAEVLAEGIASVGVVTPEMLEALGFEYNEF